ncbi:carbonic anhydrase [Natronocalculus amylovorans]|uniref:carbonic anhydrase n=1 Tax=Natronocalculus amylovorans TaxID=2917812 RepID=A0AAE3FVI1_9EURY|nr:carbonic anhydrase [Natronocalculus amylovorans]MCL9816367.1 carbonic anhydrase [Natronocalculus amylovorans]
MPAALLRELIARNDAHHEQLSAHCFDELRSAQHPEVVSVCCSDSRVSQEGMWNVTDPGWVFTPSNIGNQAWERYEGELVVSGGVAYPVHHTGTRTIAIVGHTGCGAVTAAYHAVTAGELPADPGIRGNIETLMPAVERGIEQGLTTNCDDESAINRLVEWNVHEQVQFLREVDSLPPDVDVYGFVYDFHRAYGDADGRVYLVNANGARGTDALEELVDDDQHSHVGTLLP